MGQIWWCACKGRSGRQSPSRACRASAGSGPGPSSRQEAEGGRHGPAGHPRAHLHVGWAAGCPAVTAAEAPLRALMLQVVLLLAEAHEAFTCRALGQHERAVSLVAALAIREWVSVGRWRDSGRSCTSVRAVGPPYSLRHPCSRAEVTTQVQLAEPHLPDTDGTVRGVRRQRDRLLEDGRQRRATAARGQSAAPPLALLQLRPWVRQPGTQGPSLGLRSISQAQAVPGEGTLWVAVPWP